MYAKLRERLKMQRAIRTAAEDKINTGEIEMALSKFFDRRANLMVPNVSWGFGVHECDILLVTKAGYGVEIEIKISAADLKKDADKHHKHRSRKLKLLYFAIPFYLEPLIPFIPAHAGIISCKKRDAKYYEPFPQCQIIREAQDSPEWIEHGKFKFTEADLFRVARLGVLRMWDLRETNHALALENRKYASAENKDIAQFSVQQSEGRVTEPEIIEDGLSGPVPPNAPQELNDGGGALRPS